MIITGQPGDHITAAAARAIEAAKDLGHEVTLEFNEINLLVGSSDSAEEIATRYGNECSRRHNKYIASPEYAESVRVAAEAQRAREVAIEQALAASPERMSLRDAATWEQVVAKNDDPYGACTVRYAEKWARIMEGRIATGATVESCADEASHIADDEGITGFMYGCAVSILAKVWAHGEELRRWHNTKTQINDEGERANESGGVLNPAVLTIG